MDYRILSMKPKYLDQVVNVHKNSFASSFSTKMGDKFVKSLYEFSLSDEESIFFVAIDDDDRVLGFVQGTRDPKQNLNKFIKKYKWKVGFVLIKNLLFNPSISRNTLLKKMSAQVKRKFAKNELSHVKYFLQAPPHVASIKSICVDDVVKGKGVASALFLRFEHEASSFGCEAVILSVKLDNERGVGFYEKQGMLVHWESSNTEGGWSRGYIKPLAKRNGD